MKNKQKTVKCDMQISDRKRPTDIQFGFCSDPVSIQLSSNLLQNLDFTGHFDIILHFVPAHISCALIPS